MKLGIRTKLLGAFGIVLLLAASIGAIGIFSLNKVNDLASLVYDGPFTTVSNLAEVRSLLGDIDSQVQRIISDPIIANHSKYASAADKDAADINTLLASDAVKYETDAEKQTLAAFQVDWKQYQDLYPNINKASGAKDLTAATQIYFEQAAPLNAKIDNDLAALITNHGEQAKSIDEQIDATYAGSFNLMAAILIIAFLAGGALSFFVSRNVTNAVKQVAVATRGLSRGEPRPGREHKLQR